MSVTPEHQTALDKIKEFELREKAAVKMFDEQATRLTTLHGIIDEMRDGLETCREFCVVTIKPDKRIERFPAQETLASVDKKLKELK